MDISQIIEINESAQVIKRNTDENDHMISKIITILKQNIPRGSTGVNDRDGKEKRFEERARAFRGARAVEDQARLGSIKNKRKTKRRKSKTKRRKRSKRHKRSKCH